MRKRWGWMMTLIKGRNFKIKALHFEKGKSISTQRHKHRKELWLFVFGSGSLTTWNKERDTAIIMPESGIAARNYNIRNGEWYLIDEDQWHTFEAKDNTLVLEVQFGNKCSERDIERRV